jgi:hypothetical protein
LAEELDDSLCNELGGILKREVASIEMSIDDGATSVSRTAMAGNATGRFIINQIWDGASFHAERFNGVDGGGAVGGEKTGSYRNDCEKRGDRQEGPRV